jgi:Mg2+/Co2+ transporter CorB
VMIPRHEIVGIDIEQSQENIVAQINKFTQDWLPVYRENLNNIIGVLYTRDILKLVLSNTTINKTLLEQLLQEPYFVPESTSLNAQLGYFQQSHHKIAFVVDEYGEILGLLTLNDILEEIVGDFTSSVTVGKRFQKQPDGSYLVDGAMTVREFNRLSTWELPLHGPRTINGLIVEYVEALPHAGTAVLIAGYPIEIVQVKENRVKLARISPKLKEV